MDRRFAHNYINSLNQFFSKHRPADTASTKSSCRPKGFWSLLFLALLVPQVANAIEVGHNTYLHDYPNGVPGPFSDPQAVCDARASAINWDSPLVFLPTGAGTSCSRYVGECRDMGRNKVLGAPQIAFTCPAGFGEGGSSCSNARCVRNAVDPVKDAGEPEQCAGNPVNISTGNKYQLETDLPPKGPGQIRVQRTYNSYSGSSDNHVKNWTFFYTQNLGVREVPSSFLSSIYAYRPDGSVVYFTQNELDWKGEEDSVTRLKEVFDGQGFRIGWQYTEADQSVEAYDADGKLLSITDRNGNTQTLTYNPDSNLLERVETNTGDYLNFTHDTENRIATISDNSSPAKTWTYQYDANDNLNVVTYPDETSNQYHYEDTNFPSALTGITDENSIRFATWRYDAQGRAISSEHANGVELNTLVYNADGSTTVTNPLGKETTYYFSVLYGVKKVTHIAGHATPNCLAANQAYTYDANAYLTSKTDWKGNTTTYIPDSKGLETSRIEASGTPEARTITTEWHPTYRVPTKVTEPGLETTYGYDTSGNLLTRVQKDRTTLESRTTTRTYNSYGLVETENGPLEDVVDVTTYTYYNCDTGNECGEISTITNALGHVIQFTQYNSAGQPTHITDANDVPILLTYDARQRLSSSTIDGTSVTQIDYSNTGQISRITEPNNSYLDYEYDDARRLIAIQDALGSRIEYTLDNAGNREKIDVKDNTSTLRKTQTAIYDELSRMLQAVGANSQTVSYGYDTNSNITAITRASNPSTINQYDALDRLIQITDAESGITLLDYDGQNRIKTVIDPNSLVTTYTYNGFGDLLSTSSPDTGLTVYTVDEAGNRLTETGARNITKTNRYDALNRVTKINYPDVQYNVTYGYDQGINGVGRLTQMTDNSGATSYQYDARGNLIEQSYATNGSTFITGYEYDSADVLIQTRYPSGRIVDLSLDSMGRINQIDTTHNATTQTLVSNVDYLSFGPINQLEYGNGLTSIDSYDLDYRLTDQETDDLQNNNYQYDLTNNISHIIDQVNTEQTQTFDYDALDRLISEAGQYGSRTYQYDPVSNRTHRTKIDNLLDEQGQPIQATKNQAYSYATNSNRLDNIETDRAGIITDNIYVHDSNGNITNRGINNPKIYGYGDHNRLTDIKKNNLVLAKYRYNGLGERTIRIKYNNDACQSASEADCTDPATIDDTFIAKTFVYHYDQQGQLLAETFFNQNNQKKRSREYIWLNNRPVSYIDTRYKTSDGTINRQDTYYIHSDQLNTPRKLSDQTQTLVWRWDSDAFGQGKVNNDPDQDGKKVNMPLRFPGQIQMEGGLRYNYFRDYSAGIGRYITSDPIGLEGGINTFAYVGGNPVNWIDPEGLIGTDKWYGHNNRDFRAYVHSIKQDEKRRHDFDKDEIKALFKLWGDDGKPKKCR